MYVGAWLQWQPQMNQGDAAKPESVCGYKRLDGRRLRYRMTMEKIVNVLYGKQL